MIADRLHEVHERIRKACDRCDRDPAKVKLLAVSKFHPIESIRQLKEAGQEAFGENYVQELLGKVEDLPEAEWHFIGALQTNKIRKLIGKVALIHSLDKLKQIHELEKRAAVADWTARVLVEVNVGKEASKRGCSPEQAAEILDEINRLPHVEALGLMSMPPFELNAEQTRPYHAALRRLRDDLQQRKGLALPELSMGLSHDLEPAIEEGATWIRIGTAIFGPRPTPKPTGEEI